jgi:hypothetical protein
VSHERLWPSYTKQKATQNHQADVHPEDVLVDLVEGELDQEFEKDLEIWLKSSEAADSNIKDEVEILSQLRQSLKSSDDVDLPENGLYYENLEARIMGALDHAIESGYIEDRSCVQDLDQSSGKGILPDLLDRTYAVHRIRSAPRGIGARAGHFAALAGLALLLTGKWPLQIDGLMTKERGMTVANKPMTNSARDATREAAPAVLSETIVTLEASSDLSMDLMARENVQRMLALNSRPAD